MSQLKVVLLSVMAVLMFSCGEDTTVVKNGEPDVRVPIEKADDELQIVLVPTPVQVPTVLLQAKCSYHPDYMFTDLIHDRPITSQQKAVSLGIQIVDLSYASMNRDHKLVNDKLASCMQLMDELGIDVPKDENFKQRLESNLNNIDSLSYLILTAFERTTQYFKDTDKEQLGISILTGTALESALLLAQELEPDQSPAYFEFFNQQKLYAKGLQTIMDRYKNELAMKDNLKIARNLEKAFQQFESWAASGDTTVRFSASKANLVSDILLLKESSLN